MAKLMKLIAKMTPQEFLRQTMMDAAPKPSLEARLNWLEADASAQRTAILKLEKAAKKIVWALWSLWVLCAVMYAGRVLT